MNKIDIHFRASNSDGAQAAYHKLVARYGDTPIADAQVIVALGGDGFMLETLASAQDLDCPVYGMNRGTVGFLMNEYAPDNLYERISAAEDTEIHPLRMRAHCLDNSVIEALAINEVSLLRAGPQAAKLKLIIDDRVRMEELICDGVLISTPAGSTAYNYSAHGPILPIGAEVLALTPMAAFRPRRWRGAILPMKAKLRIEVLEPQKRPVHAVADSKEAQSILAVDVQSADDMRHRILFDPGHGLEERLIREQFV